MTDIDQPETKGRAGARAGRRGGGASRRRAVTPVGPRQPPSRVVRRHLAPVDAVSGDQLETIHDAGLEILRTTGMDFLHPEALRMWADAGADIDDQRVRFDADLLDGLISQAPDQFTLHAPNPDHHRVIGGDHVVFGDVSSAPNSGDETGGRRIGTTEDFTNLVRLSSVLNAIHFHGGYPVEPIDIHPSVRHIHASRILLTESDKAIASYSLGAQRNTDVMEMVRIVRGLTPEELDEEPSVHSVINTSSPLRLDGVMAEGIMQLSARNQVIILTPFTLAGAMAPVTLAGALAQQHAEAMAGIAFTQLVRPGSPVVYGGFTSNVDMRSGAPAFGTPEFMKAALVGGQLARRLGLPYRSSNVCAANAVDAQAGYESVFSLWGAIMGGANMVFHGAGWMEGGLRASFEKMVLDADLLGMVASFLEPIQTDEASLALDAIAEVGPGGHFFGVQHTQDRFRDAFFMPMVSDWRNYESWEEAGSPTALDHSHRLVGELLASHTPPDVPADRLAELDEFIARRVAEGGVPTDY